jgi:hypothetical protein
MQALAASDGGEHKAKSGQKKQERGDNQGETETPDGIAEGARLAQGQRTLRDIGVDEGDAAEEQAGAKQGERPFQLRHVHEQTALRGRRENVAKEEQERDRSAAIEQQRGLDRLPRQADTQLDEQELQRVDLWADLSGVLHGVFPAGERGRRPQASGAHVSTIQLEG